jgi:hypothetical protein
LGLGCLGWLARHSSGSPSRHPVGCVLDPSHSPQSLHKSGWECVIVIVLSLDDHSLHMDLERNDPLLQAVTNMACAPAPGQVAACDSGGVSTHRLERTSEGPLSKRYENESKSYRFAAFSLTLTSNNSS